MSSQTSTATDWQLTDADRRAIDNARVLAMDAVQQAGNGHPGTAMSLAPAAYLLYHYVMRHDPQDPTWAGRDRFVLSAGHASLTQYVQLFFAGYDLTIDDLMKLRTLGSRTPGHPEHGETVGVEMSTGPLGQGLASAVGMAYAARRERGMFDPDAAPGTSCFDHHIYVIASDGDIEEGVTSEASSLAGLQELGNLIVIYDRNQISIEDDTAIALDEDTPARYESYGWHVQTVDWTGGKGPKAAAAGGYHEDVDALAQAIAAAQKTTNQPSLIVLDTVIAWPAPHARNTGKSHGSALGADEVAATKTLLGFDPEQTFEVDQQALSQARTVQQRADEQHQQWDAQFASWQSEQPERYTLWQRLQAGELPPHWQDAIPRFEAGTPVSTRAASGTVLNGLAAVLPELWGGSADLAGSNNTTIKGQASFLPHRIETDMWGSGDPYGRVLHFGIREHAMGSIMNGIALHGPTRVFGGTFLVFSDYMRPAVRLAALMKLPVTYVWTHDSIGVGEDGPTHQPIEHLAALRAMPGLDVVRPSDANETAWAWRTLMQRHNHPTALCLTRQDLPTLARDDGEYANAEGVARGAYVLAPAANEAAGGQPDVLLLATGSEVQLALAAQNQLAAEQVYARVVSMPCLEWFAEQSPEYRDAVLPPQVRARVSIEAACSQGWREHVGDAGQIVSIDHYGASGAADVLFATYGFTTDNVVSRAHTSIANASR